jgi:hypothetical protein
MVERVLVTLAWLHACLVAPLVRWWTETVLGNGEEALRSAIRASFVELKRFLSSLSTVLIQFFSDAKYRASWTAAAARWTDPADNEKKHQQHPGTLNEVLEAHTRLAPVPREADSTVEDARQGRRGAGEWDTWGH